MSPSRPQTIVQDRAPVPKAAGTPCSSCGVLTRHRCTTCRQVLCALCLPLKNVCARCAQPGGPVWQR